MAANAQAEQSFEQVDVIRAPSGVVAVITARNREGRRCFSFCLRKEFERNGKRDHSSFLGRLHIGETRELLNKVEDKLEYLEDVEREKRRS